MNKIISVSAISLTMLAGAFAGVREIIVTPATVKEWQVTGTDQEELATQTSLKLPAAASISRKFADGATVLYTVSRPVFGSEPENWPVMEVGHAGLALSKEGEEGKITLLVGDKLITLPRVVSLDANGRSAKALEIAVGYDPLAKMGLVSIDGELTTFRGEADLKEIEVALTAGAKEPWDYDALEVVVLTGDEEVSEVATSAAKSISKLLANTAKEAADNSSEQPVVSSSSAETKDTSLAATLHTNAGAVFEVFTPPSIRLGAETIRAKIAEKRKAL